MSQNKEPFISVIVCAYNGGNLLHSCLVGLVAQSVPSYRYEILIIDDGSIDNTFEIASNFINTQKNNTLHIRSARIRHAGLSVARNTGIFLSKGEIIAFTDQDAVADKCWVAELLKAWDAIPDADAIGGRIEIRNPHNRIAKFFHTVHYDPQDHLGIIGANMSFRKERLLQAGAFGDAFVSRGDDTFLLCKMGKDHKEVKWPTAVVFHDRPISVRRWLKERINNGEMSRLISRILGDRKSVCRSFLFRRLIAVIIATGAIVWFSYNVLWGILLLLGIIILKNVRDGVYKNLHEEYSIAVVLFLSTVWQMLSESGEWMFCFGRWRGGRISLENAQSIRGTVSDKYIIEEVANF